MHHHPAELIKKKRGGGELMPAEIRDLVRGVVDGSLGDAQLGAFLMAVCCNGMTAAETAQLTLAMRDSGRVLQYPGVDLPKIDKHSTGGIGDKVSLLLAPLVAACGVAVPMISGRGLGHTGGTIDKLEAMPGYRTDLEPARFAAVLRECGYAMGAPSADIAPADRRMYAVRDVSGTVENVALITSSILSKKLAAGIDGLVMDVKCGRGAFMAKRGDAETLMQSIVDTGQQAGLPVTALLTDMDHPLGRAIGNALEVEEVLRALDGRGPDDLLQVTIALGVEMLLLAGTVGDAAAAEDLLRRRLRDGSARARFRRNLELQGGDVRLLDEPDRLGRADVVQVVRSTAAGFVADIDPLRLGQCVVELGGGRRQPGEAIDPLVGVVLHKERGDAVQIGEPLAEVHASSTAAASMAVAVVAKAIRIGSERARRGGLLLGRLASSARQ